MPVRQLLVTVALLVAFTPCLARTVYIRDSIYVPLRGGESAEYRIIHKGIRSGTKLELVEEHEDTGYSLVRMEDGLEGYIQTQYLVDEPIARDQLKQAKEDLVQLETAHQQTLVKNQKLQSDMEDMSARLDKVTRQYDDTKKELDRITQLAANVMNIDEQNTELVAERERLEQQIDTLMVANQKLRNTGAQDWFLRGGAVVIVALLLGFWFARRIYHRRNTGWA